MIRKWRKAAGQLAICAGFGILFFGSGSPAAVAADGGDRLIVRYQPGTGPADRSEARDGAGVLGVQGLLLPRAQVVETEPGVNLDQALADLNADPSVTFAEPDGKFSLHSDPPGDPAEGDPEFDSQWALRNTGQAYMVGSVLFEGVVGADLDAVTGWQSRTQSDDVITAVIDTGISDHPDLTNQLFRNQAEIPGNGIDDDGNGLIDDVSGWDFVSGSANVDDDDGHGTHVAGTIGATGGNGIGISGVSRNAQLLPIRACTTDGCAWSDVTNAIVYADQMGAGVINMSLGGPGLTSRSAYEAVRAASDSLFVVSAGNEGVNNDQIRQFPCMIDQARLSDFPTVEQSGLTVQPMNHVICVANSNNLDRKAGTSNWGANSVDLAAPGSFILSTVPDLEDPSGYGYMSGTSMAAPQVSGIASLVRSQSPRLDPKNVKAAILAGTDPVTGWSSYPTVTGGRVDLAKSLANAEEVPPAEAALLAPAEGLTSRVAAVAFNWQVTEPGAQYRLLVDGAEVAAGVGLANAEITVSPGVHSWKVVATNEIGLSSESATRSFKYAPDGLITLAGIYPNRWPRVMNPRVKISEAGQVRVKATARFRWSPRAKPKKRVIAKAVANRRPAGASRLKVPLTKAGLRLKRVAPRSVVTIRFEFRPELGGAPSVVTKKFRFRKARR